jgi:hypothetical protein
MSYPPFAFKPPGYVTVAGIARVDALIGGFAGAGGFVVATAAVVVVAATVVEVDSAAGDASTWTDADSELVVLDGRVRTVVGLSVVEVVGASAATTVSRSAGAAGVRATRNPIATRAVERIRARIVRCITLLVGSLLGV